MGEIDYALRKLLKDMENESNENGIETSEYLEKAAYLIKIMVNFDLKQEVARSQLCKLCQYLEIYSRKTLSTSDRDDNLRTLHSNVVDYMHITYEEGRWFNEISREVLELKDDHERERLSRKLDNIRDLHEKIEEQRKAALTEK